MRVRFLCWTLVNFRYFRQIFGTAPRGLGAMIAPARLSREVKMEYVNFLLIVDRMTLPQYWRHMNNHLDGTVLVHSMQRVIAPGYTNFKVVFHEHISTGHHQVTSCSAQELLEDMRFSHVYFPVFFL